LLEHLFHLSLPVAEKLIRPAIMYFVLIGLLRIFGKRELAQLNPFDLVVLLSLSNVVQNALIGDDNSITGGIIGAFTLLGVNWLTVRLLYLHPKLDEIFEGAPRTLILHGEVQEAALCEELLSMSDLRNAAHRQSFESLDEVDRCVLEPGGTFSFYRKQPSDDTQRYDAIMNKLEELSRELQELKGNR
jgi:uncharacterized membrane protein YcaP (DUF421 family)